MRKTIHTRHSQAVQRKLLQMREQAGLTQRQLAERLAREHSFVWRIEHGERRLDVVEFFTVCQALGQDASRAYAELVREFKALDWGKAKRGRR